MLILHLVANASVLELLLDVLLELDVLVEPLGVVFLLVPLGRPSLDDTESESDWMCFLTHYLSFVANDHGQVA